MKTLSLILTLAAGTFAASVGSAQPSFSEDWSAYPIGADVVAAEGSAWYAVSTIPGSATIIAGSGTDKWLRTAPAEEGTTAYIGHALGTNLAGKVLAEVDVKVTNGGAEIFLSDSSSPFGGSSGTVRIRFASDRTLQAYDGAISGDSVEFGEEFSRGNWYRASITMDIDPSDGSLSRYSVSVIDLTTSLSVGSIDDMDFYGSPVFVDTIAIGSMGNGVSEWGELSVTVIPEPAHVALVFGLLVVAAGWFRRSCRHR